jgi:hypothetical protein
VCAGAVLNHFAVKSILHFADNNWIQLFSAKCKMDPVIVRKVQNALIAKWLSTALSQKIKSMTVGTE